MPSRSSPISYSYPRLGRRGPSPATTCSAHFPYARLGRRGASPATACSAHFASARLGRRGPSPATACSARRHSRVPEGEASRCRSSGAGSRPAPARALDAGGRLPQRRERRRDQHLVLLPDRADTRLRRPLATLARLFADARALVGALVRPHVHELVEPAELARPARGQRRELLADRYGLAPRLEHRRQVAGRVRVDAHLVEIAGAEVAATERLHERRRDHDVGLLLDDQIAAAGQLLEVLVLRHRIAHGRALLEILVRPDVDDLVERAEVGVPEGAELGVLLAKRLALREAILELGHGSGAQRVGANLVDHRLLLLSSYGLKTANTLSEFEIHDSRKTDSSGLRRSSAIAPARQNQFNSS